MLEFLHHGFGWVCGQSQAHTWSPGGEQLPCCQRCTGVYVGAFAATLLHLAWRPAPTSRWLGLNGALLLFIIPSGFYWIPQNPELRCASGVLFGFSLVAFLRLCLARPSQTNFPKRNSWPQLAGFAATVIACLVFIPLLAGSGSSMAAHLLGAAAAGGALALLALVLANVWLALRWQAL